MEERAGSSFLRCDGTVWTTDKDGIIPCLLSAEITARSGKYPGEIYLELTRELEDPSTNASTFPLRPNRKPLWQDCHRPTFTPRKLLVSQFRRFSPPLPETAIRLEEHQSSNT